MRFEGNMYANYLGTWTAGWNELNFRWRIDFPKGVLVQRHQFEDLNVVHFQPELALTGVNMKYSAEPMEPIAIAPAEHFVDDTRLLLVRFFEALKEGKPVETSGKDHLRTLGLVFACIESSKTGKEVNVPKFYKEMGLPE
jgi:hypothetical protein